MNRTVYKITRWDSDTAMTARSFSTWERAPAAKQALRREVYAMLAANGLLDRPCADRLVSEAMACEVSPPPRGHMRAQSFKLSNGASVTFEAMRERA